MFKSFYIKLFSKYNIKNIMDTVNAVKSEFQTQVVDKTASKLSVAILVKYLLEGFAVTLAAYVIPNKRTKLNEIAAISLLAALTLFVLDLFATEVSIGARFGTGLGIGMNLATVLKGALPLL